MKTWWEQSLNQPFVAYLCFCTTLPLYKARGKKQEGTNPFLFDSTVGVDEEGVEVVGYTPYTMRLPYTQGMLMRRFEDGRDIPEWFTVKGSV